jgi:hypothetical protein
MHSVLEYEGIDEMKRSFHRTMVFFTLWSVEEKEKKSFEIDVNLS